MLRVEVGVYSFDMNTSMHVIVQWMYFESAMEKLW